MNRQLAREIAEKITNDQLVQMFNNAKMGIKDWTKVSDVNKGITKGTAWNILAKNFDPTIKYHILGKTNMVREFGEFLPNDIKPLSKKAKPNYPKPTHFDPIFD